MADVPSNPDSGAAGTEYQTIHALRRLGHDVDEVWADSLPHRIRHGNLHYLLELPYAYEQTMMKKLVHMNYDVIHVNQPHGFRAARRLSRMPLHSIFIHRSHGLELRVENDLAPWEKLFKADKRGLMRRVLSSIIGLLLASHSKKIACYADGHIVSASQCKNFLHKELGVPANHIAVIPQAPSELFLASPSKEMTKVRLNRVLYVGQFAFVKAPIITAKVMSCLAKVDPDLQFTWVCSQQHHASVRELLAPEVRSKIELLDWMPQKDLVNTYDNHGIFLFPSFFEGFGKVFLEAMSRGLCVVAADNGGAHDIIKDGEDGMLVPTGNVDVMVQACLNLVRNPDLAGSMSKKAVDTARRYSWDRVARETASFYQDRLNAKARTRYNAMHSK